MFGFFFGLIAASIVGLLSHVELGGAKGLVWLALGAAFGLAAATLGAAGKDQFRLIHEGHFNPTPTTAYADYIRKFKQRFPDNDVSYPRTITVIQMLARALEAAGSDDPLKVALALENMEFTNIHGDRVFMRSDDHQLFQPVQISVHTDENVVFDGDNSGFGLVTELSVPLEDTMVDHSCHMRRP